MRAWPRGRAELRALSTPRYARRKHRTAGYGMMPRSDPFLLPVRMIENLNDNVFALATELLAQLSDEVEREAGRRPTLEEMCELLTWGFRSCNGRLLSDHDPLDLAGLKPVMPPKRARVKELAPGDIVAVPSANGGYHLIVFLVSNRVGWGFGILRGRFALRPPKFGADSPAIVSPPVYTHPEPIKTGRWPVIGHAPELVKLFPARPEVYYEASESNRRLKLDVGQFGSAADPDTLRMRHVSQEEAEEVGLLDGRYRATYLGKLLEEYLDRVAG